MTINHSIPKAAYHDIKRLQRRGLGVYSIKEEKIMSNDVKGLAQIIGDEVAKLRDTTTRVRTDLQKNMAEAHEAVQYVEDMNKELARSVADLRGVLGMTTNNPPKE